MKAKDCSDSKKEWIRELIKALKEERAQFTKELTNEFMFTRATMVEEEWVRSKFAELDIQHIINMHQTDRWTDVPRDVEVKIAKHKIVRVR